MTRAELIDSLAKQFVYNNPQTVDAAVREIFEIMIETLSLGERIEIRGFGSFEVRIHEPRVAHNPKTGEHVTEGGYYRGEKLNLTPANPLMSKKEFLASKK